MELWSLPMALGWHQSTATGDKIAWISGQCSTWLSSQNVSASGRRLRALHARELGFQCPCTLDSALADPSFGTPDPFCTQTYCQYGNYVPLTHYLLRIRIRCGY